MFINRIPNLQRIITSSSSQIMRITLFIGVISVGCRYGVKKVDILRGEDKVSLNSTAKVFFLCEMTLIEDG
jgi:hypothetical protein